MAERIGAFLLLLSSVALAAPPDPELSARAAKLLADAGKLKSAGPGKLAVGKRTLALQVAIEQSAVHEKDVAVGIAVHCLVDGQPVEALTSGSIGLDATREGAVRAAVQDWVTLAGGPIVKALAEKKAAETQRAGGFLIHSGGTGIRGTDKPDFGPTDPDRHERLLHEVEPELAKLIHDPKGLHALTVMMVIDGGAPSSSECRVDGERSELLCRLAARVPWPRAATPYMLKQFYVLEPAAAP